MLRKVSECCPSPCRRCAYKRCSQPRHRWLTRTSRLPSRRERCCPGLPGAGVRGPLDPDGGASMCGGRAAANVVDFITLDGHVRTSIDEVNDDQMLVPDELGVIRAILDAGSRSHPESRAETPERAIVASDALHTGCAVASCLDRHVAGLVQDTDVKLAVTTGVDEDRLARDCWARLRNEPPGKRWRSVAVAGWLAPGQLADPEEGH
jgi:hypothetical protein